MMKENMSKVIFKRKLINQDFDKRIKSLIQEIKKVVFFNKDNKKLINQTIKMINYFDERKRDKNTLVRILKKEFKTMKFYLLLDLTTYLENDPACFDYNDVIISYPGFFSLLCYRYAHILYKLRIPYLPRLISEFSHHITGIDISSGAEISHHCFIDHGTGIVIGETSKIGHHVNIYHGVTLGALSLKKGKLLKGKKRHPTIKNYVTIYSNASILGGETIIDNNVTIGSNIVIDHSIEENSIIIGEINNYQIIKK